MAGASQWQAAVGCATNTPLGPRRLPAAFEVHAPPAFRVAGVYTATDAPLRWERDDGGSVQMAADGRWAVCRSASAGARTVLRSVAPSYGLLPHVVGGWAQCAAAVPGDAPLTAGGLKLPAAWTAAPDVTVTVAAGASGVRSVRPARQAGPSTSRPCPALRPPGSAPVPCRPGAPSRTGIASGSLLPPPLTPAAAAAAAGRTCDELTESGSSGVDEEPFVVVSAARRR
eukprot:TRINITY_DN5809_c0_g1_i2.p1 TRINITY_DN5809_c0_g1~~TRINITY_DN5809_c0_g1_i2.p1  ORF type:complete len:242 (+),score=75.59 TRINITY_DN5809_c0_g1_i2:44-727(+)